MSKNIHIPEPCHENWADFTPTQKGAFCGSCQIDVVDFSNKSPDEVKQILKENAGKHLCGRFKKSQLDDLNNNFYQWENQSQRSFQSKFLYACIVVFGMSLFSSCSSSEQSFLSQIGIELNEKDNAQLDMTKPASNYVEKDTNKVKTTRHIKGKVKYTPIQEEENVINTNCAPPDSLLKQPQEFIKGDVIANPQYVKGNIAINPIEDTVKQVQIEQDTLFDDIMVDGEIEISPDFIEYIEDTTKQELMPGHEDVEDPEQIQEVQEDKIMMLGKPAIMNTDFLETPDMCDEVIKEDEIINGVIDEALQEPDTNQVEQLHIKGEIAFIHEFVDEPQIIEEAENSVQTKEPDSPFTVTVIQNDPAFEPTFDAMLFPNPAIDNTKVVITVEKTSNFDIYLYAIDGKRVKNLYQGLLSTGRNEFVVDLSAYEAGSYLIVINSDKQKESLRVEKLE